MQINLAKCSFFVLYLWLLIPIAIHSMSLRVTHLFFDMNSYFASVAQAKEPALRERPVGVLTTNARNAACIAASVEAKRFGVKMGVRRSDAVKLCPNITFRVVKHDVCMDYHHAIRKAAEQIVPIHAVHSVDEFSCHLLGREQDLPTALEIGRALQENILHKVNPALRCSVGLGPNRLLAKIAAELEKPMGLNWLLPPVLPNKIAHLKLSDLPGISKGMTVRLNAAGVRSISDLMRLAPKHARAIWRSVEGERFLRALRGETVAYPKTKRGMIGHGQVLSGPNTSPEGARLVARRLIVKAAARLRREGYFARYLSLSAKDTEYRRHNFERNFAATQDTFILLDSFTHLWANAPNRPFKSVAIMLGGLVPMAEHIPDLFENRQSGEQTPREALCRSLDRLNLKYGQDTIRFGEMPYLRVPYTGAKIAFGRIPDPQDFYE